MDNAAIRANIRQKLHAGLLPTDFDPILPTWPSLTSATYPNFQPERLAREGESCAACDTAFTTSDMVLTWGKPPTNPRESISFHIACERIWAEELKVFKATTTPQ